ncbi:MAG: hypothetical protein H6841_06180 [Planctomycetes bacterium]|nr:hypothetical protein [Planctomycetota bacterium]
MEQDRHIVRIGAALHRSLPGSTQALFSPDESDPKKFFAACPSAEAKLELIELLAEQSGDFETGSAAPDTRSLQKPATPVSLPTRRKGLVSLTRDGEHRAAHGPVQPEDDDWPPVQTAWLRRHWSVIRPISIFGGSGMALVGAAVALLAPESSKPYGALIAAVGLFAFLATLESPKQLRAPVPIFVDTESGRVEFPQPKPLRVTLLGTLVGMAVLIFGWLGIAMVLVEYNIVKGPSGFYGADARYYPDSGAIVLPLSDALDKIKEERAQQHRKASNFAMAIAVVLAAAVSTWIDRRRTRKRNEQTRRDFLLLHPEAAPIARRNPLLPSSLGAALLFFLLKLPLIALFGWIAVPWISAFGFKLLVIASGKGK